MKNIIRLEEVALFGLSIWLFSNLPYAWWWFPVLILVPDIGMLGYVFGNKTGAVVYNIFHHRGIAVLIFLSGVYFESNLVQFSGIILLGHASMDRIFGYGLKYKKGFKFTHLGELTTQDAREMHSKV